MAYLASVSQVRSVPNGHDDPVSGLVMLFEGQFATMSWAERYSLLEEIFDYLEENSRDRSSVAPTFAQIVEQLVARSGSPEISCNAQAHVYAASTAQRHRRLAGGWFARKRWCGDGRRQPLATHRYLHPA